MVSVHNRKAEGESPRCGAQRDWQRTEAMGGSEGLGTRGSTDTCPVLLFPGAARRNDCPPYRPVPMKEGQGATALPWVATFSDNDVLERTLCRGVACEKGVVG